MCIACARKYGICFPPKKKRLAKETMAKVKKKPTEVAVKKKINVQKISNTRKKVQNLYPGSWSDSKKKVKVKSELKRLAETAGAETKVEKEVNKEPVVKGPKDQMAEPSKRRRKREPEAKEDEERPANNLHVRVPKSEHE